MRYFLSACLLVVLISACRDDFELNAPYQDIPVVYAFLDINEPENFVRVQKAFLGIDGNAEVAARNVDSLYYGDDAATVTIQVANGSEVALERVNAEDFGFDRDTGFFANTPNILYRLPEEVDLEAGRMATVRVERTGEPTAMATTTILAPLTIGFPNVMTPLIISSYRGITRIRWSTSEEANVYDIRMYMNIREFNEANPEIREDKRLEWVIARSYQPDDLDSPVSFELNNELFWQFLDANLDADAPVIRQFLDLDLVITGVGSEVREAIELATANGGITSAQSTPTYTNVENGLGIVTSRTVGEAFGISLDTRNNDTLRNGVYTADLNFQ